MTLPRSEKGWKWKRMVPPQFSSRLKYPWLTVRARRKKEFDATVAADTLLMPSGRGPDVPVFDPEHHKYGCIVIGHSDFGFRKMIRPVPHMMAKHLHRDILPWQGVPGSIIHDRSDYPFYPIKHIAPRSTLLNKTQKAHPELNFHAECVPACCSLDFLL